MLKYVITRVMEAAPAEMAFLDSFVEKGLIDKLGRCGRQRLCPLLPILTPSTFCRKSGQAFEYPVSWGMDLQTEHERYLTEKHFGKPVFVSTTTPRASRRSTCASMTTAKTVGAVDMLVPGIGELVGGSQREERLDVLLAAASTRWVWREEQYGWYLDTRRFGTTPHAGFGLGFERLVMYLTGHHQHPRCAALSPHHRQRGVLIAADLIPSGLLAARNSANQRCRAANCTIMPRTAAQ